MQAAQNLTIVSTALRSDNLRPLTHAEEREFRRTTLEAVQAWSGSTIPQEPVTLSVVQPEWLR